MYRLYGIPFSRVSSYTANVLLFACTLVLCYPQDIQANERSQDSIARLLNQYVSGAEKLGSVRFKYMFWELYDASLYSAENPFSREQPFALKLDYLRDLKGDKIAERSLDEMRKLGFEDEHALDRWSKKMHAIFPDVKKGDFILGIKNHAGEAIFYKNQQKLGMVDDPLFSRVFFNIWLGENERAKEFQEDLLKP